MDMLKQMLAALLPVLVLVVSAAPALAISKPSVSFIPDKISTNGSFIAIADPRQSVNESLIVVWEKDSGAGESNNKGSFPKTGGKYACYFSSTDEQSTCGPAPFKVVDSARKFFVTAVNQDNTSETMVANISVGDIQIQPMAFISGGRNISIRWPISTFEPSALYYKVYYAGNFTETPYSGSALSSGYGYMIDIPTGGGDYFVSLKIEHSGTGRFGGTVVRISVPETGISLPSGKFLPSSLFVTPASFEVLLNRGQNFSKGALAIINTGTVAASNIAAEMLPGLEQYISISFSNTTIIPNGTIYYTVNVAGAQSALSLNTRINITSNGTQIGQIPLNINVSIVNGSAAALQCPTTEAGSGISLDKQVWTGDYIAGQTATLDFMITNSGKAASSFNYSSDLGSSLSVNLPGSLQPGRYSTASASIEQSEAGKKSGYITITSPQGSAAIAVLLNFHKDINASIEGLSKEYASFKSGLTASQRSALAGAFAVIESDISSAGTNQESGSYAVAEEHYNNAAAGLSVLKSAFSGGGAPITTAPSSGGGGIDMMTVLIAVVVVAAAAFAFVIIKRRRNSGGDEELEEELAEDFGPLPADGQ